MLGRAGRTFNGCNALRLLGRSDAGRVCLKVCDAILLEMESDHVRVICFERQLFQIRQLVPAKRASKRERNRTENQIKNNHIAAAGNDDSTAEDGVKITA
jgi:hypothetical protein